MIGQLPNVLVSSLVLAGLYTVVSLAWVILFRATKLFNFATAQFIVLGAYIYFLMSVQLGLPFIAALLGVLLVMAAVGTLVQVGLMSRLAGAQAHAVGHAPFGPVILTFGIAAVVQHAVAIIFGRQPVSISMPLPWRVIRLPGTIAITPEGVFVWIVAAVLLVSAVMLIRYSKWGIRMRASAEQAVLASQSGINVGRVFIIGWVAATAIAALAGISYSFGTILSPDLSNVGLRGLAPAIVGGMDSAAGVLPGAIIVALVENMMVLIFGEGVRDAAVMVVVLVFLTVRPTGLFGSDDIRRI